MLCFDIEKSGQESATELREVDVPIVKHQTCADAFKGEQNIIQNKMMCAGYTAGKKDACTGKHILCKMILYVDKSVKSNKFRTEFQRSSPYLKEYITDDYKM